ncbi:MAG: hypothetical protein MHMPM18_001838 [Marteilia pararefringens]
MPSTTEKQDACAELDFDKIDATNATFKVIEQLYNRSKQIVDAGVGRRPKPCQFNTTAPATEPADGELKLIITSRKDKGPLSAADALKSLCCLKRAPTKLITTMTLPSCSSSCSRPSYNNEPTGRGPRTMVLNNDQHMSYVRVKEYKKTPVGVTKRMLSIEINNERIEYACVQFKEDISKHEVLHTGREQIFPFHYSSDRLDISANIVARIINYLNEPAIVEFFQDYNKIPLCITLVDIFKNDVRGSQKLIGHSFDSCFTKNYENLDISRQLASDFEKHSDVILVDSATLLPSGVGNLVGNDILSKDHRGGEIVADLDFLRTFNVTHFVRSPGMSYSRIFSTQFSSFGSKSADSDERAIMRKFMMKGEEHIFGANFERFDDPMRFMVCSERVTKILTSYLENNAEVRSSGGLGLARPISYDSVEHFAGSVPRDKNRILKPAVFRAIRGELQYYCQHLIYRQALLASICLVATLEEQYYATIEPQYGAASIPKLRVSLNCNDVEKCALLAERLFYFTNVLSCMMWRNRRTDYSQPLIHFTTNEDAEILGPCMLKVLGGGGA